MSTTEPTDGGATPLSAPGSTRRRWLPIATAGVAILVAFLARSRTERQRRRRGPTGDRVHQDGPGRRAGLGRCAAPAERQHGRCPPGGGSQARYAHRSSRSTSPGPVRCS